MTDDTGRLRPRVRALGADAAWTALEWLAPDGEVDLPDYASQVTLEAF